MPTPKKGESESNFVSRCIPIVIGEGKPKDQAVAICHSMYKQRNKKDMKFLKEYGSCQGPLDFPMQDADARDLEQKLETGEWKPFKFQKGDSFEAFFPGEKSDISVVTDGTIDKDGEIVNPDGVNWDVFRKNPVVTFGHNYKIPPIGKSLWQKKVAGGVWKAKTKYIEKPKDYPQDQAWFPESIFHMIKEGSLPGKSIGGAMKAREATKEESERGIKRVIDQTNVYEYSVVTVASNNNAIVEAIAKSALSMPEDVLQNYFPEVYEQVKTIIEEEKEQEESLQFDYVTPEQFKENRKKLISKHMQEIEDNMPEMVENTLKRLLGKVC